jgi:hypothetical protein
MAKGILTFFLVIGLLILGAGIYLGHNGINKLETSYADSTERLQAENRRLTNELQKALADKVALEAQLRTQAPVSAPDSSTTVATTSVTNEDTKAMAEQIKALSEAMQKTVESCQIRPKPIKRAVVAKKAAPAPVKVEEKIIIKEVPAKPQTIVINKIFIQEGKSKPKLIKREQKVLPEAYPNDLLK